MSDDGNNSIHPKKIFFLLVYIHAFLLLFALLIPEGGLHISDTFTFKFVALHEVFEKKNNQPKDIKQIVSSVVLDTLTTEQTTIETALADSNIRDTVAQPLIINSGTELAGFFEALSKCEQDKSALSIAYYGDSQVEGDRFSDYLRNRLQKQFGGGGPGIVTPIDISNMRITVQQAESKEWTKIACFGYPLGKLEGARYGISGALYRYRNGYYVTSRIPKDSTGVDSATKRTWVSSQSNPWLSFKKSRLSYASVKKYSAATLWYTAKKETPVKIQRDGSSVVDTLYPASTGTRSWKVSDSTGHIRITFLSPGADVIGLALDEPQGVHVDNFSMRGSSGTDFSRLNGAYLAEQHRLRGTKLLVLQFGVNVVPYVDDSTEVVYYERSFLQQLQLLKRQMPEVSILVVGTTDISTKEGTAYVTYPYLEQIRDAQKRAAQQANCAFWDAYAAMGGKNSMPAWVFNQPPLAAKDFTHLSSRGANVLAQLLHEALMNEYYKFKRKSRLKPTAQNVSETLKN
ncbi:MAG: hypothetical protein KBB37_09915 [Bacteroidia bacterium]|nr:hypothetical protein [Bacteroidia bacterium]MBP7261590.1 hypothetical protein [Bacteroidia bacterium]MBP9180856.1 hypothetical protein [Bacteroidia bacterium]MBP9725116.1 hypothetical protein [Bacteroidia bacterium]